MTEKVERMTYLLYLPVHTQFVPLVVVEPDFVGPYVHFQFSIAQAHRKDDASVL